MGIEYANYPNVSWPQFAVCNPNATESFEDMTRSIFYYEFLHAKSVPHSNSNQAGVEVEPILEPVTDTDAPCRYISFQSKYFENKPSYAQIKHSLLQAAEKYPNKLDHIYLFCNKAINTDSKPYIEIENVLRKYDISIQPISDKDLLMLVKKYRDIADYYFIPRGSPISYPYTTDTTMILTDTANKTPYNVHADDLKADQLTDDLLDEKITLIKHKLLEMKLKEARTLTEHVLSFDINNGEKVATLSLYRLLLDIFDGTNVNQEISHDQYYSEAKWIIDFYKAPYEVPAQELVRHLPEIQVFAISKLFASQMWSHIKNLHSNQVEGYYTDDVKFQLCFFAGMSSYNMQDFELACTLLYPLRGKYEDDKYAFFSTCAEIARINFNFRNYRRESSGVIVKHLQELDGFVECHQYKSNIAMVAILSAEAYYNLALLEEQYLDEALQRISALVQSNEDNPLLKYFLGLCLEVKCDFDKAAEIYMSLDWKNDDSVASRYLFCLLQKGQYDSIKDVYSNLSVQAKSERSISVFISALEKSDDKQYKCMLQRAISEYGDSLHTLFAISFYVENKESFTEFIVPILRQETERNSWNSAPFYVQVGFLMKCARLGQFREMADIFYSIKELHSIDDHVIYSIFKSFLQTAQGEFNKHKKAFQVEPSLDCIDKMSEIFISKDILPQQFLLVRYYCAGAWQKPYSMLKMAKQLFEGEPQEWIARNIVALLCEQGERNYGAYLPYINILKESQDPDHCVVMSLAYRRMEQADLADFYMYKAIYHLDGKKNYSVLRSCAAFAMSHITRAESEENIQTIKGKTVVIMKRTDTDDTVSICFDSENELDDENNHSLECEHLNPNQWEYTKLMGKRLGHKVTYHKNEFEIVAIQSRTSSMIRYIFQMIQKSPDEFDGVVWFISTTDATEMIEKLKELTPGNDHVKTLVDAYDFYDNSLGLPIDAFVSGDYSKYVEAIRMLLFVKDLIFHAGQPSYCNFEARKCVPAISTLVILSQFDWLEYLVPLKDNLLIPQSYMSFFKEQYSYALALQTSSPGTMYFKDDQIMLVEQDKTIPEIWEKIIEFCDGCKIKSISTDDRISLNFGENISGEQLMSGFKIHVSQMDSLILAQQEAAIYLCDDLFFRKLASSIQVENVNLVSLLIHYEGKIPFDALNTLSETNYFLVPFLTQNDDEATKRVENYMEGERKRKYYAQYLANLMSIIHAIFDDSIDPNQSNPD